MKKVVKFLSKFILIISILLVFIIIMCNVILCVKILFFGFSVGSDVNPDTIWWSRKTLYGIQGIKTYYSTLGAVILISEVPIIITCIIYQLIYFKVIRKKLL